MKCEQGPAGQHRVANARTMCLRSGVRAMKTYHLVLLVIGFIGVAHEAEATRQSSDKVIVGDETFGWRDSDLSPVATSRKISFHPPHTACYRGYEATWIIKEKKLVLKELKAWTKDPESGHANDLPVSSLFPDGLPVIATWYTGDMHLLQDTKLIGGKVAGHLVECKYVTHTFEEGELMSSRTVTDYFNIDIHEHTLRFIELFRFIPEPSDFERSPNKTE